MAQSAPQSVMVRGIQEGDVEAIIQIDARISGEKKAGFWRGVLAAYMASPDEQRDGLSPDLCQIAEVDGKVAGFMVGDIQSWQFGIPRCGRIVTVGVLPDYRRHGIGNRLIEAMFDIFRKFRVPRILCLVHRGDPLGRFFGATGFEEVDMQVQVKKL